MGDLEKYRETPPNYRSTPARNRALLDLRRRGVSYDQIAEELGMEDRFEVIDALNEIYKGLSSTRGGGYARPDIREVVDYVDGKIDELVTVFHEIAIEEKDIKAANFVLKAVETKARIHGGISPTQINVQVNNDKPWDRVYRATITDGVIEGLVVGDNDD